MFAVCSSFICNVVYMSLYRAPSRSTSVPCLFPGAFLREMTVCLPLCQFSRRYCKLSYVVLQRVLNVTITNAYYDNKSAYLTISERCAPTNKSMVNIANRHSQR